jgi:DNA-directed RNA polymerase specialized sigma24 family protein
VDGADELERVYRQEATRIRAALAARLGDVGLAEELVHDAFIEALEHWRAEGAPPNPGAWLATTARRKAIDRLRRERAGQEKLALLATTQSRRQGPGGRPGGTHDLEPAAGQDDADELVPRVGELAGAALFLVPGHDLRHPCLKVRPAQLLAGLGDQAQPQVLHHSPP